VPVLPLNNNVLLLTEPTVGDYFSIPRAVDPAYHVCDELMTHPGDCTDRDDHNAEAPAGVFYAYRNAVQEVDRGTTLFPENSPERAEYSKSRDLFTSLNPPTFVEVLSQGLPICLRRPGSKRSFYVRTPFVKPDGTETDLANVTFDFKNHGSVLQVVRAVGQGRVGAEAKPFANVGPNRKLRLDVAQLLAEDAVVFRTFEQTLVGSRPHTGPSTFADMVQAAHAAKRDFLDISIPFSAIAGLFGFDPASLSDANQKGHVDIVSALIKSYQSRVLDEFPCRLSLATTDHRGRVVEWVRKALPREAVVTASKDVRSIHERAFLPDSPHGQPGSIWDDEQKRVRFAANRLLFSNNKTSNQLELMDLLVNDYLSEIDKVIVQDTNNPENCWINLPCIERVGKKGKRRMARCHTLLHFLISALIPDLLLCAAPKVVLEAAMRKFGETAHKVLHPFITDNADEIKARVLKTPSRLVQGDELEAEMEVAESDVERPLEESEQEAEYYQEAADRKEAEREERRLKREEARQRLQDEAEERLRQLDLEEQNEEEYAEEQVTEIDEEEFEQPQTVSDDELEQDLEELEAEAEDRPRTATDEEDEGDEEEQKELTADEATVVINAEASANESTTDTDKDIVTDIETVEDKKVTESVISQFTDRMWPLWSSFDEDQRRVMHFIAKKCLRNPAKVHVGSARPVLDPITQRPMQFGLMLNLVNAKEYINGLLKFVDVSNVLARLTDGLHILLRPKHVSIAQLASDLQSMKGSPTRDLLHHDLFTRPFNPQLRLEVNFRQYKVSECLRRMEVGAVVAVPETI